MGIDRAGDTDHTDHTDFLRLGVDAERTRAEAARVARPSKPRRDPPPPITAEETPGARLDALVAEHILGWSDLVWYGEGWGREHLDRSGHRCWSRGWFGRPPEGEDRPLGEDGRALMAYQFHSDAATAMRLVIAEMQARGYIFTLTLPGLPHLEAEAGAPTVWVRFTWPTSLPYVHKDWNTQAVAYGLGHPAPLAGAICVAALRTAIAPGLGELELAGNQPVR